MSKILPHFPAPPGERSEYIGYLKQQHVTNDSGSNYILIRMKILRLLALFCAVAILFIRVQAQQPDLAVVLSSIVSNQLQRVTPSPLLTNGFFITDDGQVTLFVPGVGIALRDGVIARAREAKDSRPAAEDPEGNWGEATNGFQLSVRFGRTNFTKGTPVNALITFRNVTTNDIIAPEDIPRFDTKIFVENELTKAVVSAPPETSTNVGTFQERVRNLINNGHSRPIMPGAQVQYSLPLKTYFQLTNGTYKVWVRYRDFERSRKADITSGFAKINISN